MTSTDRRLLLVHAHPDDETINNGATMARYAAQGVAVTLVTCTLGELGEVLVPELAELEAGRADQLGGYRIAELASAMRCLGVADHRFLGAAGRFRDSGMIGTDGNVAPRAFWRAEKDETVFAGAVNAAVSVMREVRPQVVVTYDPNGGYGHPDHIMAHRVTTAALTRSAQRHGPGEPWTVPKVYWTATPRSAVQAGIDAQRRDGSPFERLADADDVAYPVADDQITTTIDARDFVGAKAAAMRAHATQITVHGRFYALSNKIGHLVDGEEHYRLVHGTAAGPFCADGRETDLFAGLA